MSGLIHRFAAVQGTSVSRSIPAWGHRGTLFDWPEWRYFPFDEVSGSRSGPTTPVRTRGEAAGRDFCGGEGVWTGGVEMAYVLAALIVVGLLLWNGVKVVR